MKGEYKKEHRCSKNVALFILFALKTIINLLLNVQQRPDSTQDKSWNNNSNSSSYNISWNHQYKTGLEFLFVYCFFFFSSASQTTNHWTTKPPLVLPVLTTKSFSRLCRQSLLYSTLTYNNSKLFPIACSEYRKSAMPLLFFLSLSLSLTHSHSVFLS